MSERIIFIGHTSIDKVKNIYGEREQPGGAALYSSIAAKTLYDNVGLISAIGKDYKYKHIFNIFKNKIIKEVRVPSTYFEIYYDEKWNAKYTKARIGAGRYVKAEIIPTHWMTRKNVFHISPMTPSKVERIIDRIRKYTPKSMISVNSWSGYMKDGKQRKHLMNIMKKVDLMVLNETEAKLLAKTDSLTQAMNLLKCKMLVVTLGSLGALIKMNDEIMMVPALTSMELKIMDTTGAGDSWCGAFLAAYKLTGEITKAIITASLIATIKCTGWGFEELIKLRFQSTDDVVKHILKIKERDKQKRLTEYFKRAI
ncbi:MAG: carbohydrate kinase family protein [Candidatus Methanomethylicia archaeon]